MINRDGNVWFHHDFYSQFARQSDAFVSYFIKWHGILSPQYSVCLCQCIRWLIPGCWCFKSLGSRTEMVVSNGIAEFIWGYVYRLCCVLDAVYCPYWWPLFTPFRDWVTAPQCVGMNEKQILSEFYLKCFWSAFPIPPLWLCINWWLVCVMNRMNTAATIQNGMSLHSMPSNVGWNDESPFSSLFCWNLWWSTCSAVSDSSPWNSVHCAHFGCFIMMHLYLLIDQILSIQNPEGHRSPWYASLWIDALSLLSKWCDHTHHSPDGFVSISNDEWTENAFWILIFDSALESQQIVTYPWTRPIYPVIYCLAQIHRRKVCWQWNHWYGADSKRVCPYVYLRVEFHLNGSWWDGNCFLISWISIDDAHCLARLADSFCEHSLLSFPHWSATRMNPCAFELASIRTLRISNIQCTVSGGNLLHSLSGLNVHIGSIRMST